MFILNYSNRINLGEIFHFHYFYQRRRYIEPLLGLGWETNFDPFRVGKVGVIRTTVSVFLNTCMTTLSNIFYNILQILAKQ